MMIDAKKIKKSARKLGKFMKHPPKRPASGEIHDLRTNSRRFEAAVDLFELGSHKNERRMLRSLARVRKRAGKIRDVDVMIGFALAAHTAHKEGEQDCLMQLLEALGENRGKHVKNCVFCLRRSVHHCVAG
jgi:CHAD domain-containing protein